MMMTDKEKKIDKKFHRTAKSILEMFQVGEILTGHQENILIDTIHDL